MKRTADKLFGDEYVWSVLAAGRHQIPCHPSGHHGRQRARWAGGQPLHRPGRAGGSNAELVTKIRTVLEELGMEIASPADVREILKLKGQNQVAV